MSEISHIITNYEDEAGANHFCIYDNEGREARGQHENHKSVLLTNVNEQLLGYILSLNHYGRNRELYDILAQILEENPFTNNMN